LARIFVTLNLFQGLFFKTKRRDAEARTGLTARKGVWPNGQGKDCSMTHPTSAE